jgi:hypothetical protein
MGLQDEGGYVPLYQESAPRVKGRRREAALATVREGTEEESGKEDKYT